MTPQDEEANKAFLDYVEAKAYAEAVHPDFEAAFAAGQAWVRFLNTFLPLDQQMPVRPLPGSNVIEFPRRYEARS